MNLPTSPGRWLRRHAATLLCAAAALAMTAPAAAAPKKPPAGKTRKPAGAKPGHHPGAPAAASQPGPAQPNLEPPRTPAFDLTIDKTTLPNGLRVVLQPDRSSTAVGVAVAFAAGPRHESKEQQGFASAVTRAMAAVPSALAPERVAELSRHGASLSIVETPDLVAFVDLVPAGALELTLWLESRRPRLDTIPAAITESLQRDRADRDKLLPAPGSLGPARPRLEQLVFEGFWPYEHDPAALASTASPESIGAYQHAWFTASNASICISGAFDPEPTLGLVRKYFGDLPKNASPPAFNPSPLPDQTNQRSAAAQADIKPFLAMGWAVPSTRQPEHDALALTTAILGEGPESRFAQKLSKLHAAASFAVELDERRGPSMLTISLQSSDDAGLLAARKAVDDELDSLARLGPTTDEMRRVWRTAQSAFLDGLQRPEERALRLANLELLHGDARLVHAEIGRRLATGKDDIRKAVARFLSPTRRSIVEMNAAGRAVEVAPRPAPAAPPPAAPVAAPAAPRPAPAAAPAGPAHKPAHKPPKKPKKK